MVDSEACVVERFADSVASTLEGFVAQCRDSCFLRSFGPGYAVFRSQIIPADGGLFDVYKLSYLTNPQDPYESLGLRLCRSVALVTGQGPADRAYDESKKEILRLKEQAVNSRMNALLDAIIQVRLVDTDTDIAGNVYVDRASYPAFQFSMMVEPEGKSYWCHVDNSEHECVHIDLRPETKIIASSTGKQGVYREVCLSDIQPFYKLFPVVSCWAERALRVDPVE